jgi:hypothetical protein
MGASFNVAMFRVFQAGSNINQAKRTDGKDGGYPLADPSEIVAKCANIRAAVEDQGQVDEPWWRNVIGVAKFCIDGDKVAHEWSKNYSRYDPAETQKKLDNWTATGATLCTTLADHNPQACATCQYAGRINSPIVLGYPGGIATATAQNWVSEINEDFAWIEADASIYRLKYGNFIEPAKFKVQFDNQTINVASGQGTRTIGKGTHWLKHPNRRQHDKLVIRPAEGPTTQDNCLNEWRGFSIKPVVGNIKPFLWLLLWLVPNRAARRYVLRWLAHLVQHPAIKMHVSLVFWSLQEGVGKNLLFECMTSIIGATHSTVIAQSDLADDFNSWANCKVLVIGDEVSNSDRRQDIDKLKGLVTGATCRINEKFQAKRLVPNLLNFIFLSNSNDALFVGDTDRRYFVWEATSGRLSDANIAKFLKWRDNGGLAALLHFLLHFDISGFNPKAPAPMTEAKQQMVQDNRSDLENWIAELMGSNICQVIGRELATGNELARRYAHETGHREPSAKTIVGTCKKHGAYARTSQVRLANGRKVRVLALERPDHWKLQPEPDWATEMAKAFKLT